jgi:hypothetical protein
MAEVALLTMMPLGGNAAAGGEEPQRGPPLLTPLPIAPGVQFHTLGFSIQAPWLTGRIELRMPETLHSSLGLHFIDHRRPDMPPLAETMAEPVWQRDEATGSLSYEARTREGLVFAARADPESERVRLAFHVRNQTGQPLRHVSSQQCLVLGNAPQFNRPNTLDSTFTWVGGQWQCLNRTTPTAADKGRDPWILMPVAGGPSDLGGQREMPAAWWVVNEVADAYLIARQSADGQHLVAITWDDQPPGLLMSNTRIPCLHAGPMRAVDLAPGAAFTWHGVIYLVAADPQRLATLLREDQGRFGDRGH